MNGSIKFYNATKGYGFLIVDETKEEIFFHVTGIVGSPPTNEARVTFETEDTDRGRKAINVQLDY